MSRQIFMLLLSLALTGCATHAATSGRVVLQDGTSQVTVSFNERDRALIHDYYSKQKKKMPPGLAKREGKLPPGLAKRETLPPGLQREALPFELERQLTPLPSGYVRLRVERDIVLLDNRTRVIVDVIHGVAF